MSQPTGGTDKGPEPGDPGQPGEPGEATGAGGTGGSGGTGGAGGAGMKGDVGETGETGQTGEQGERGLVGRLSSGAWIVFVVACLVLAGIGVSGVLNQRASNAREAKATHERDCLAAWAGDFTDYYQGRIEVGGDVRDATVARDKATVAWQDAVGGIFQLFIVALSPDQPPQAELEEQFTQALTDFSTAEQRLADTQAALADATAAAGESDPPPVLDLDCTPPK